MRICAGSGDSSTSTNEDSLSARLMDWWVMLSCPMAAAVPGIDPPVRSIRWGRPETSLLMKIASLALAVCFACSLDLPAGNVLLFTIDSCRADRFGCYGHWRETTPRIDAWAKTGVVFRNAYSTSAWTAPGLVSILTGLAPPTHRINNRDHMGFPEMPTLLKPTFPISAPERPSSRLRVVNDQNLSTFQPRNKRFPSYFG